MEPDSHPQRRAPRGHAPIPMTDDPSVRAMHINQLKERIERSAYTVDADAVAEALLRRPSVRRTILPAVSRAGARSRRANGSAPRS
jgi:Anti-sigma-28 factor, FlgM